MGVQDPAARFDLDPTDPGNEPALVALLTSPQAITPAARPLAESASKIGCTKRIRAHADIVLGYHLYAERKVEQGSTAYRRGLQVLWDTGSPAERNACVNLASACAYQGRLLESLVLARRGRHLAALEQHQPAYFVASQALLRALAGLGDWERFDALRDATAAFVAESDDANKRFQFDTVCVDAAVEREHADEAARHLESAATAPRAMDDTRLFVEAWAHVHLLRGQYDLALDRAATARKEHPREDELDRRLRFLEILAAAAKGNPGAAQAARTFLDSLADDTAETLPPGRRMRMASRIARDVGESMDDRLLAARAYEVAGAAALERMAELEVFRLEFPQAQSLSDEDAMLLDEYRQRFLGEHGSILDAVRRLFRGDAEAVRVFREAVPGEDPLLRACAWCGMVRGPEGLWVDLGESSVPEGGSMQVSHGVCLTCRTSLVGPDSTA